MKAFKINSDPPPRKLVGLISRNGGIWLRHRSGRIVFIQNDSFVEENMGEEITLETKMARLSPNTFDPVYEGDEIKIVF